MDKIPIALIENILRLFGGDAGSLYTLVLIVSSSSPQDTLDDGNWK